jgi:hypothetical protein
VARKLFSSLFCFLTLSAASYGSTIIFQDNFDSYSPGTFANLAALGANWTVSNSIDVVGPGFHPELVVGSESVNAIDLDGDFQGGLISTSIFLAPGNYTLVFDLNGSQRGVATSTTVTLGSFVNQTILQNSPDLGPAKTFSFSVGAGTTTNLVFTSNTPGNIGALLDNVSLFNTSIPEPSTFGLMLGAIPLLLVARKRYARK